MFICIHPFVHSFVCLSALYPFEFRTSFVLTQCLPMLLLPLLCNILSVVRCGVVTALILSYWVRNKKKITTTPATMRAPERVKIKQLKTTKQINNCYQFYAPLWLYCVVVVFPLSTHYKFQLLFLCVWVCVRECGKRSASGFPITF